MNAFGDVTHHKCDTMAEMACEDHCGALPRHFGHK